ncbi:MAG: D-aminoacyl-tRNA deacylase [Arenimonas sp.]
MLALIQRVTEAAIHVDGMCIGKIAAGLLALVAVEPDDDPPRILRMAERLLAYRVFADGAGKMNLSLADTGGGLLLVPQFTLAADTTRGLRPSFSAAAPPEHGRIGFDALLAACRARHAPVESGQFGAHMMVSLCNDGPVTFLLTSA